MMRFGPTALATCMLMAGGCASRGNVELLESQLRQQEDRIYQLSSDLQQAETDLNLARRESESLRTQLADRGQPSLLPEQARTLYRISGVRVNSLLTGGLDRDGQPGDELFNLVLTPHDEQGESVKLPGSLEIEVFDLEAPPESKQVARWQFSAEEVAVNWQSGLSSGFQFRLPWPSPPTSEKLIVHARLSTVDGRQFGTSAEIRVTPDPVAVAKLKQRTNTVQHPPAKNLPTATFPEVEFFPAESTPVGSQDTMTTFSVEAREPADRKPPLMPPVVPLVEPDFLPPIPKEHQRSFDSQEFELSVDEPPPTLPPKNVGASELFPGEMSWKPIEDEPEISQTAYKPEASSDEFLPVFEPPAEPAAEPAVEELPMRYRRSGR